MIDKNHGNDFVGHVTETDSTILSNSGSIFNFWNKTKESSIDILGNSTSGKCVLTESNN